MQHHFNNDWPLFPLEYFEIIDFDPATYIDIRTPTDLIAVSLKLQRMSV